MSLSWSLSPLSCDKHLSTGEGSPNWGLPFSGTENPETQVGILSCTGPWVQGPALALLLASYTVPSGPSFHHSQCSFTWGNKAAIAKSSPASHPLTPGRPGLQLALGHSDSHQSKDTQGASHRLPEAAGERQETVLEREPW